MNELGNSPADKNYKPSGISKAEEKANKRWPIHPWTILPKEGEHGEIVNFDEWLDDYRIWVQSFSANQGYAQGYEQAEKDTIERAIAWLKENANKYIVDIGVGYGEHGRNVELVVGGMCWEHLQQELEEKQ